MNLLQIGLHALTEQLGSYDNFELLGSPSSIATTYAVEHSCPYTDECWTPSEAKAEARREALDPYVAVFCRAIHCDRSRY